MLKLLKSVKVIPTVAVMLSAALLTLATGGCGDVTTGSSDTSTATFTVTPGAYIRRTVTGSGKISFSIKGVDMGLEEDKQPLVHFYDDNGYGAGRKTGGFHGELRNYKLKYYDLTNRCVSESYHGYRFSSDVTYNVVLEWKTGGDGYVRSIVDGKAFEKPGQLPETFTLGIGYSPNVPGWDNAVYTNVVWPAKSTEIK